jgi:hypothetical protein
MLDNSDPSGLKGGEQHKEVVSTLIDRAHSSLMAHLQSSQSPSALCIILVFSCLISISSALHPRHAPNLSTTLFISANPQIYLLRSRRTLPPPSKTSLASLPNPVKPQTTSTTSLKLNELCTRSSRREEQRMDRLRRMLGSGVNQAERRSEGTEFRIAIVGCDH